MTKIKRENVELTSDMTIGEVIQNYPETINVLIEEGIHCVGCGAATHETLEEGLIGHGKSKDEMDAIMSKLNETVAKFEHDPDSIIITELAAKEVLKLMKAEKKEGYGLRLEVIPGGCSGVQYNLDFEEKSKEKDHVVECNGVKVFVDSESFKTAKGSVIDYIKTQQGEGFNITNPSMKQEEHGSCSCQ